MCGHDGERGGGGEDSNISYEIWDEEVDVLLSAWRKVGKLAGGQEGIGNHGETHGRLLWSGEGSISMHLKGRTSSSRDSR